MKKLIIASIVLVIAFLFWNCEKDDICEDGTPTTPRMIVEFYDNLEPTTKKTVTNLGIVADGMTTGLLYNGVSKIEVPLQTTADITKYSFIFDSQNVDTSLRNTDKITINYTKTDVFISRACGYKTVFSLLDNPNGIVKTIDTDNWIKEIVIQKYKILNEDEVHVKIFF
ncbi:hypothetical protein SAMN05660845_0944 [Flavobacterium swingsii]|uniref:Uncharacterized protein n=1 Tax=Flavobacterium swingsii TaxID=498292 RepID=A0A1I0WSE1_9FLAO|nr:DUF6452 family protein [Flavobacterium swingsii]SFA91337.1 hypothetical protein SAMN05660845_0944 [Flavobacterium swingsii]